MRRFAWAMLVIVTGFGPAGCGGDSTSNDQASSSQALNDPKAPPKVTYPAYILYLQPTPNTNPLFKDADTFIKTHGGSQNLAASYPPHVSLTGFFNSKETPATLISTLKATIHDFGPSFGQPMIQPKKSDNPKVSPMKVSPVYCSDRVITLHVKMPETYKMFRAKVTKALGAEEHAKGTSHITLFETEDPKFPDSEFDAICTAARNTFTSNKIDNYNSLLDGNPSWQIALFEAVTKPTPTNPLSQTANALAQVPVNPKTP